MVKKMSNAPVRSGKAEASCQTTAAAQARSTSVTQAMAAAHAEINSGGQVTAPAQTASTSSSGGPATEAAQARSNNAGCQSLAAAHAHSTSGGHVIEAANSDSTSSGPATAPAHPCSINGGKSVQKRHKTIDKSGSKDLEDNKDNDDGAIGIKPSSNDVNNKVSGSNTDNGKLSNIKTSSDGGGDIIDVKQDKSDDKDLLIPEETEVTRSSQVSQQGGKLEPSRAGAGDMDASQVPEGKKPFQGSEKIGAPDSSIEETYRALDSSQEESIRAVHMIQEENEEALDSSQEESIKVLDSSQEESVRVLDSSQEENSGILDSSLEDQV